MATQIQRRRRRRRIRRRNEFGGSGNEGYGVGEGISGTQKLLMSLLGPVPSCQGQRSAKPEGSDEEKDNEELSKVKFKRESYNVIIIHSF